MNHLKHMQGVNNDNHKVKVEVKIVLFGYKTNLQVRKTQVRLETEHFFRVDASGLL